MITNLTPHTIHFLDREFPPSGTVARCVEETTPLFSLAGMPIVAREYGEVKDLPEARPGDWFIVSHMCRVALPSRLDLLSPGDLARDEEGNITGCLNFVANREL